MASDQALEVYRQLRTSQDKYIYSCWLPQARQSRLP